MTARHDEFERVAMPHSPSLLRVARRISGNAASAEDLVQETLLKAWRSFYQFERGTNARAWLFRIMFNAFHAEGRKVRSRPAVVSLEYIEVASEPGKAGLSLTEAAAVMQAFDGLSDEHRTVLLLGVVEGFTCREMAEILSIPIGTVMSRLSRARQALRENLSPAEFPAGETRSSTHCAGRGAS